MIHIMISYSCRKLVTHLLDQQEILNGINHSREVFELITCELFYPVCTIVVFGSYRCSIQLDRNETIKQTSLSDYSLSEYSLKQLMGLFPGHHLKLLYDEILFSPHYLWN